MSLDRFQRMRRFWLAIAIIAAFVLLLTVRSGWSHAVHERIEAVGLGLIIAGILGRMWCTLYIGDRKSAEIVDAGPYSVTRNPLYVFSSIAAAGVGAQTGSLILAALFAAGCVLAFQMVIREEEKFLASAFGEPYASYCERVPRFMPDVRLFHDEARLTITPARLYRTLTDGLAFLLAIPAFEAVEHLQNAGYLSVALRLW
ncbi:isoprenylcysteine carboxylmethyltransferase family protein [Aureimonas sp. ME7]|uniref:methyltransferase family protein n=1 Tax=Aureimonas sp. ME7 TaxID=2744252 RepID=UPI0015F64C8B|nr:isoprenylcysteine carboxylmethyltransferase family protein [Aureimonas sp. ME7]